MIFSAKKKFPVSEGTFETGLGHREQYANHAKRKSDRHHDAAINLAVAHAIKDRIDVFHRFGGEV